MSTFIIKVVRIYSQPSAQYLGRAGKYGNSPLANRFWMKDESQRNVVCDQYQAWFDDKIKSKDAAVKTELVRLWKLGVQQGHLELGCFCAPKRCHCNTIKNFFQSKMI